MWHISEIQISDNLYLKGSWQQETVPVSQSFDVFKRLICVEIHRLLLRVNVWLQGGLEAKPYINPP